MARKGKKQNGLSLPVLAAVFTVVLFFMLRAFVVFAEGSTTLIPSTLGQPLEIKGCEDINPAYLQLLDDTIAIESSKLTLSNEEFVKQTSYCAAESQFKVFCEGCFGCETSEGGCIEDCLGCSGAAVNPEKALSDCIAKAKADIRQKISTLEAYKQQQVKCPSISTTGKQTLKSLNDTGLEECKDIEDDSFVETALVSPADTYNLIKETSAQFYSENPTVKNPRVRSDIAQCRNLAQITAINDNKALNAAIDLNQGWPKIYYDNSVKISEKRSQCKGMQGQGNCNSASSDAILCQAAGACEREADATSKCLGAMNDKLTKPRVENQPNTLYSDLSDIKQAASECLQISGYEKKLVDLQSKLDDLQLTDAQKQGAQTGVRELRYIITQMQAAENVPDNTAVTTRLMQEFSWKYHNFQSIFGDFESWPKTDEQYNERVASVTVKAISEQIKVGAQIFIELSNGPKSYATAGQARQWSKEDVLYPSENLGIGVVGVTMEPTEQKIKEPEDYEKYQDLKDEVERSGHSPYTIDEVNAIAAARDEYQSQGNYLAETGFPPNVQKEVEKESKSLIVGGKTIYCWSIGGCTS
jgi:hypothetical protein